MCPLVRRHNLAIIGCHNGTSPPLTQRPGSSQGTRQGITGEGWGYATSLQVRWHMPHMYLIKLSSDGINWTVNDALIDANQLTFLVNHCANMWIKVVTQ